MIFHIVVVHVLFDTKISVQNCKMSLLSNLHSNFIKYLCFSEKICIFMMMICFIVSLHHFSKRVIWQILYGIYVPLSISPFDEQKFKNVVSDFSSF